MSNEIGLFVNKEYRRVREENLKEIHSILGFGFFALFLYRADSVLSLRCLYQRPGWFILRTTGVMYRDISFKPDRCFNGCFGTGNGCTNNVITFENNKLIHEQVGKQAVLTVTEFFENKAITKISIEGVSVIATIHYARYDVTCGCY